MFQGQCNFSASVLLKVEMLLNQLLDLIPSQQKLILAKVHTQVWMWPPYHGLPLKIQMNVRLYS